MFLIVVESVASFQCLDSIVNENFKVKDVQAKTKFSNREQCKAYFILSRIFENELINRTTKVNIYKTLIRTVLTLNPQRDRFTVGQFSSDTSTDNKSVIDLLDRFGKIEEVLFSETDVRLKRK